MIFVCILIGLPSLLLFFFYRVALDRHTFRLAVHALRRGVLAVRVIELFPSGLFEGILITFFKINHVFIKCYTCSKDYKYFFKGFALIWTKYSPLLYSYQISVAKVICFVKEDKVGDAWLTDSSCILFSFLWYEYSCLKISQNFMILNNMSNFLFIFCVFDFICFESPPNPLLLFDLVRCMDYCH